MPRMQFEAATASHSQNYFSSAQSLPSRTMSQSLHKHPILEVDFGPEFNGRGAWRVVFEGEGFPRTEISQSCHLELTTLPLRKLEPVPVVVTVIKDDPATGEEKVFGMKHCELQFRRQSQTLSIRGGENLAHNLTLTVRLYC